MLIDPSKKQPNNEKGFNPTVQNEAINSESWMMPLFIFLSVITVGLFLIYWVYSRNYLNREQLEINNASSNISVQLAQRSATLTKLVDATKSQMNYEQETLVKITQLRSIKSNIPVQQFNKAKDVIDAVESKINVALENYPNLRSNEAISQLMNAADLNEREIAASRRLYNVHITSFNKKLFTFPSQIIAAKLKLYTLPLFVASEKEAADISLNIR